MSPRCRRRWLGRRPPSLLWRTLARADGVPVDGSGRVDEDRVPVAALLALVHNAKCLVDGENLGIEDLLVGVEVEAAARPATG